MKLVMTNVFRMDVKAGRGLFLAVFGFHPARKCDNIRPN